MRMPMSVADDVERQQRGKMEERKKHAMEFQPYL